jgi:hypothetical protein
MSEHGDVKNITVGPDDPQHVALLNNVQKVSDRVADMLDQVDVNEAIDVAEAMIIFAGSIIGKAFTHGMVNEKGLASLKVGSMVNFGNAIQGEIENGPHDHSLN